MIRIRAILIGLLAVIVLAIVIPCGDLFWIGTFLASTQMPVGAIVLFFFFVFILNTLLKTLKVALSTQELLLIYAMMAVASGIPSMGLTRCLFPILPAPFYFANSANRYAEILHGLIPDWMAPRNPDTIKYLYEGLPQGGSIPYKDWILPLFWWALLTIAIFVVMFSLAIIFRKQWIENEKLVFPLVHLPIQMAAENKSSLFPEFFKNKIMWLAFLIPAIVYSIKGLHFYFPAVPDIRLEFPMNKYFVEKPWNSLDFFQIKILFAAIGFAYLLPASLSFSIWFFYLLFQLQTIIGASLGFQMPTFPGFPSKAFHQYQVAGGMLVFAILLFWSMRDELKNIFRRIWNVGDTQDAKEEVMSFRLALIGLIGGFLFICFWAMAAGVRFWVICAWAIIFFLIVIVTTRFVAEGGLYNIHHDFYPLELILPFTGSAGMGAGSIFTLGAFNQIFARTSFRVCMMPFFLNNFKIAGETKIKRNVLNISMWLAIILAIVVSFVTYLNLMYRFGMVNLSNEWTLLQLPNDLVCKRAINFISSPVSPNLKDVLTMIIGGGVTAFLFWMPRVFLWWPFHPLGYLASAGWMTKHIWFSTMLAWVFKSFVLRFGGIKIYRKFVPAFLGLVLGEFLIVGVWTIIDLIAGAKGHFLMYG